MEASAARRTCLEVDISERFEGSGAGAALVIFLRHDAWSERMRNSEWVGAVMKRLVTSSSWLRDAGGAPWVYGTAGR